MKELDAKNKMCPELTRTRHRESSNDLRVVLCQGSSCAIWDDWFNEWERETSINGFMSDNEKNSLIYAYYNEMNNLIICFELNKGEGQCGYINKELELP